MRGLEGGGRAAELPRLTPRLPTPQLLLTRRREMATHPPEVLVLQRHDSRTVMYTYYDAETGKQTEAEGYVRVAPGDLRLASRMQAHDATHRQLVVVVDSEGDVRPRDRRGPR